MNAIWKEPLVVRSYDVGNAGVLKAQAIFQFFQEAIVVHAVHLGVGHEALQKLGLILVLSRVKVEIINLLVWGDEITLTTWPTGFSLSVISG
jgi:acyl-CoA thioesterase FadM